MGDDSNGSSRDDAKGAEGGSIWQGLKTLLFGNEGEHSLRREIEEVLDEYDEEHADDTSRQQGRRDLNDVERQMLRNLLHFSERRVSDVAVPRSDVIAIEEKSSFADVVALFADAGHSRVPVYRDKLDEIVGMIHIRDVFALLASEKPHPRGIETLIRQPLFTVPNMGALNLLSQMRQERKHLAIVVDEYSGTEGIVTFEDLVEEIVGEVEDEHDEEPEIQLTALEGGMWDADARTRLETIARDIDPRLADLEEDVDTVGGLAFVLAGHVPEAGEVLVHADTGWRLEILQADGRRVLKLRLHPPQEVAAEE